MWSPWGVVRFANIPSPKWLILAVGRTSREDVTRILGAIAGRLHFREGKGALAFEPLHCARPQTARHNYCINFK